MVWFMVMHAYKPILYMGVSTAVKCTIYYYLNNNIYK